MASRPRCSRFSTSSQFGYNLPRYTLAARGETAAFLGRPVECGAHQRSIELILEGAVDAAAIDTTVLEHELRVPPELNRQLKVIETLGPSPIPPLVLSCTVAASLRTALLRLLLAHGGRCWVSTRCDRLNLSFIASAGCRARWRKSGAAVRAIPSAANLLEPLYRMSAGHNADVAGDTTEWIERGAQNLADLWTHLASASGGRTARWSDVCAADAGSACPFVNSTVLLKLPTWAELTHLTHELDEFYAAGEGGSWLLWSSRPTPDLTALGYVNWGQPPLMVRPAGGALPPQPSELRIVEVTDAAGLAAWEVTFIEGYPLHWLQPAQPGALFSPRVLGGALRLWVGMVNDEPVGVAAAFVSAGVVGVHMVATMSGARGRGYGAALTWQAVLSRPDLPAVLQASDMGRPVYERMGFHVVAPMSLWERPRH